MSRPIGKTLQSRILNPAIGLLLLAIPFCGAAPPPAPVEFRGAWVHYQDYVSAAAVSRTVAKAKRLGLNALLPLANHPDNLMFRSTLQPLNKKVQKGFDPLLELAKAAHAEGIEVHPYFLTLNGKLNGVGTKLAKFRMLDRAGKTSSDWLCPTHPEVRQYFVQLVTDCLYAGVDGVQLDYIRYPDDARFCYCAACRAAFKAESGMDPIAFAPQSRPTLAQLQDCRDRPGYREWSAWRRQQVTQLAKELSDAVRAKRPGTKVSAAAGTQEVDQFHVFRDGAAWLRAGLVDFLCPMMYVVDEEAFRTRAAAELLALRPQEYGSLFSGLPAYKLRGSPQRLVEHVASAREFGFGGVCLFPLEYLDESAVRALSDGPFQEPAVLPWRAAAASRPVAPQRTPEDFCRLGLVYKQTGDLERAKLSFYAALALDPKHADSLHRLAWTLAAMQPAGAAAPCFERFLAVEPEGVRADEARAALERLRQPAGAPTNPQ
ncbi:MAG: hypothetical protein AUJ96_32345 [Armatimonadetes bacterium CG2_30_66_41]|nr:family 10 glycosylhydrolase [Armatimonadota bacterium]NCO92155.1 family 10 glycosylhydrolase [Armatimonadota bacterium]NCP32491.1 family 10 glycosylhydrolase [Armatimonadota bacterium]NDK15003.1 family 10 glycosylhydrolase [Armatimonadota bacterium]OIO92383.1 MAG: hypothetical protein AUJ96_32345 [Armatimonadetes bacterium CG2_30_66_41]